MISSAPALQGRGIFCKEDIVRIAPPQQYDTALKGFCGNQKRLEPVLFTAFQ